MSKALELAPAARTTRDKLLELRAVAERLALGEPGDRWLRGLFVDLVDALMGGEPNHPDVNLSGARQAPLPPERVGMASPPPRAAPAGPVVAAPAGASRDMAAPVAGVADPAGDDWMAGAEADVAKVEASEAAGPPKGKAATKPAQNATPNGGH